ncbi:TetR/AcrR family transcriptional regulator [Kutzneria viridogrisea]|uniref:HTH tetR-type domain-containing protein n=2 Tax=Kutzneria TaxID=43356 RepID=W5WJI1_9PSEU|nr:TetR-like C-terminal domain-containing protein [Kutzneria albida]AHI01359.1 hypothetical protein KALB_8001 [Kutzneria albida DSM 43870]MBA8926609.1 AcrR family transcriptional regulator [Kutzneria viridogrisea]
MARPKTHDEALRQRLLARAGELISSSGVDALSLRRLAADVDTSTTAVYSLFGGKPGLVRTVYLEAYRRFGARLRAVGGTGDAAEDVVRLGLAYRENALAEPHLYDMLFTGDIEQDEQVQEVALAAFQVLVDAVDAAVVAGVFRPVEPRAVAIAAWGLVHGLVSLELRGKMPPGAEVAPVYELALRAAVDGWRRR